MKRLALAFSLVCLAGTARAQTDNGIYCLNPDWSPDGTAVAFEGGREGQLSIFTIGLDGQHLTRLTSTEFNDEGPVWSPDGTKIAFFSNRSVKRREQPISLQIYVMNADGSGQHRITREGPALEFNISWSPDSRRLVFQSRPEINPGVHSLYVIGVDGSGRERITDGQYDDTFPQWSPTGEQILYLQSAAIYKFFSAFTAEDRALRRSSVEVALLNLDDRTTRTITRNELREKDPSWGAEGSEIFYFQEDGELKTLYRQTPNEQSARAVADGHAVSNGGFVSRTRVSPDGRLLVYNKEADGFGGIYVYDLNAAQERLLVGADSRLTD